jgi:drug/metabolite transporter, DME family
MQSSFLRSRLLLVTSAVLFSTGGAAFKAVSLTAWQVSGFRSGIAAVVLLAVIPEARRGWSWRIFPVAAAYAATLLMFVLANRLTTAANAIFLQSTAPLYLLLLSPLLLHEPIRRSDVLYIVAVLAGISLFLVDTQPALVTAPDPRRGNWIALGSGVSYAFMLAGLRWLGRYTKIPAALGAATLGNILAFVCALPLALPVANAGATDILVLLYLGIVQIGLAYVCLTRALRDVPGIEATTLLMIEPALSPLWSWLVHGERPGVLPLAGGAVIIAASLVNTWRRALQDGAPAASPPPL